MIRQPMRLTSGTRSRQLDYTPGTWERCEFCERFSDSVPSRFKKKSKSLLCPSTNYPPTTPRTVETLGRQSNLSPSNLLQADPPPFCRASDPMQPRCSRPTAACNPCAPDRGSRTPTPPDWPKTQPNALRCTPTPRGLGTRQGAGAKRGRRCPSETRRAVDRQLAGTGRSRPCIRQPPQQAAGSCICPTLLKRTNLANTDAPCGRGYLENCLGSENRVTGCTYTGSG